jgi:alkanesulfonate monooxygenase SsuD/methylene tetrahydromethanopterin reductase-like flavin-dependent oxidoreductase (luciferase family)
MPYLFTPKRFAQAKAAIKADAARHGRDLVGFHWALYQFTSLADDYEEAHQRTSARLSRQYDQDFTTIAERYCAIGVPERAAPRLRAFADAGVQHFILTPITPPGAAREHIEWYARDLLPALRG